MSIADNIRIYREKAGLSQPELAEKMPVDVSWIRYWETGGGQLHPADVARLSQVLEVDADVLRGKTDESSPKEVYQFQFSAEQVRALYSGTKRKTTKRTWIVLTIAFAYLIFCSFVQDDKVVLGIVIGLLLCLLGGLIRVNRAYKNAVSDALRSMPYIRYEYNVFDDHFTVRLYQNMDYIRYYKVYFEQIKQASVTDEFLTIEWNGVLFALPKAQLVQDSCLLRFVKDKKEKKKRTA